MKAKRVPPSGMLLHFASRLCPRLFCTAKALTNILRQIDSVHVREKHENAELTSVIVAVLHIFRKFDSILVAAVAQQMRHINIACRLLQRALCLPKIQVHQ